MNRIRVSELAKELGLETKAVLAQFNKIGIQVKNHLSMVNDGEVSKLKAALHTAGKQGAEKDHQQKSASKIFIRRKALETPTIQQEVNPEIPEDAFPSTAKSETNEATTDTKQESGSLSSEPVILASTAHAHESELTSHSHVPDATHTAETQTENLENTGSLFKQTDPQLDITEIASAEKASISEQTLPHVSTIIEQHVSASSSTEPNTDKTRTAQMSSMSPGQQHTTQNNVQQNFQQKEISKPATPPATSSAAATTPTRSTSAFTGATIVRRAPETSNVYQVKMTRPHSGSDGYQNSYGQRRPQSTDGRFQPRPTSPDGRFQPRSPSSDGRFQPRPAASGPAGSGRFQQKSFVMPDALPAAPVTKDSGIHRGLKEREKKRSFEDTERSNKNSRVKGTRFYEEDQYIDDLNLEGAENNTESVINVRTMTASKKRKPASFKRKEHTETHLSNPTKASKKIIRIDAHISVNDLAGELSQKVAVIIKTLLKLGMFATANKVLDFDTATLIAQEFGYETQNVSVSLEDIISQKNAKQQTTLTLETRPPIITIMGHVDHGKTSLLDALRQTNVAGGEAGGITQHIGAYQIEYQNRKLTFLDTPGHEAFTAMRARGAQVTDVVVLVVAADDGVMPQTIEAIAHAKAANVPLIVAINKIDKPNINLDRIIRELSEHGVISEEWGGDSMFVQVSAKTHKGLDTLIESILLQADVLDLKAPATGFAEGVVIEARRDKSRGPVATVIVTKGLLKQQDSVVIGKTMGRVRAMYSSNGTVLKDATPGTPVELIGLDDVPDAGDMFNAVASDAIAREAVAYRLEKHRQAVLASQKPTSTNDLMALFAQKDSSKKANELSIIIKADTHGSAEAIKAALQKLDTEKVKTKVVLSAVGGITETDIVLADASRALVLGFNVRPDKIASQRAEAVGIKIMFFNIIYELIEAVKISMAGTLEPIKQDKIIGHAEIRNLFTVPKVGVIAGSFVTDGKITRPCRLRIVRDGVVQYTGQIGSLKRFKEDAKEVMHGFECGIGIENYNDLKIGDVIEAYIIEEIAAEL